jgi:chorismate--pyruvate lyase
MRLLSSFSSVPPHLFAWLSAQTAITQKLDQAQLRVLQHDWQPLNWWEQWVLGIERSQEKLIRRDILMRSHQENCWFARTMIPRATYLAAPDFFDQLHHKPLSKLIYSEPRVERYLLRSYTLSPALIEYHWVSEWHEQQTTLGARFSSFRLGGGQLHRFHLLEIFLPGLDRVDKSSLSINAI